MWGWSASAIMLAMTSPVTSSKVLLVADRRRAPTKHAAAPLRRYRLARLRFDGRAAEPSNRFEHLKRVFD
jgi:hypothetical protein